MLQNKQTEFAIINFVQRYKKIQADYFDMNGDDDDDEAIHCELRALNNVNCSKQCVKSCLELMHLQNTRNAEFSDGNKV